MFESEVCCENILCKYFMWIFFAQVNMDAPFESLTKHLYSALTLRLIFQISTNILRITTSSVSPKLLHGFARSLAPIAFLRNITLLSINIKVIWQASLLKNCEQANQCNNSRETEEVSNFKKSGKNSVTILIPFYGGWSMLNKVLLVFSNWGLHK